MGIQSAQKSGACCCIYSLDSCWATCSWWYSRPSKQLFVTLLYVSKVPSPTVIFGLDFSFVCLLSTATLQPWCHQLQGYSLIGTEKHYRCIWNAEGFSKSLVYTKPCFQAWHPVPFLCNTKWCISKIRFGKGRLNKTNIINKGLMFGLIKTGCKFGCISWVFFAIAEN